MDSVLVAYLLAFFNPVLRSLRTIEALECDSRFEQTFSEASLRKSTFSDAAALFDPHLLRPIVAELKKRLPDLEKIDSDLGTIVKRVVAMDGWMFTVASSVAWAIHQRRTDGRMGARVRLDLSLSIHDQDVESFDVAGVEQGSESKAMIEQVAEGKIYVIDRNYVHFAFLRAIIDRKSDFVVRGREDAPGFTVQTSRPLNPADQEHGVVSDETGIIPATCRNIDRQPPTQTLRRIVIRRPGCEQVILFTTLLEPEAQQIGAIYKMRWQIELFFRWLKVYCRMGHLVGHSRNAVTLQFYVAVIGMLLMYISTGNKPDLYMLVALGQISQGHSTLEKMMPWIERRRREKENARLRREKKKT